MSLTTIGTQRTPGRPTQITYGPNQSIANAQQQLVLIGHMAASGSYGTGNYYKPYQVSNVGNDVAASGEVAPLFGYGSELTKMVVAAVQGNLLGQNVNFPPITVIPLNPTDTDFGSAFSALNRIEAEVVVSPYDGAATANGNAFKTQMNAMSGAQNVQNNQFGSIGVMANFNVTTPNSLPGYDTGSASGILLAIWKRDSSPTRTVGELAAAAGAVLAANPIPFNPLDGVVVGGEPIQALLTDNITIGSAAESETALGKGWCPLRTLATAQMAIVRSVSTRTTIDGVTPISNDAYVDVQDFQVLFLWRKTLFTRFSQPDMVAVKASVAQGQQVISEAIRLANSFEDQNMFQQVAQLAKLFQLQRNVNDRSRFDLLTPVNVIPGLHVIATNIQAGTLFDSFTL